MDEATEQPAERALAATDGPGPQRGSLPDYVDRNEAKRRRQVERIDARLAQAALSGKQPRRRSPWRATVIGWTAAAVVVAVAVWGVHAFVNRDRVLEPATVGGLSPSTNADLIAFTQKMQAERPVVGGLDFTQMTVTPYGGADDYAVVWIWPAGGLLADSDLLGLAQGDDELAWSGVETYGETRCITGRSTVDDTGEVFCLRTGKDVSVLIEAGAFPDPARTAAMVDEVYAQQPDA